MSQSVRYRLVWHLLGLSNEVSKRCMKYLSRHHIHAQSSGYLGYGSVVGIGVNSAQGQLNHAIVDPALRDQIDKHHASLGVPNFPSVPFDKNSLAGFNDDFVVTHNHPLLAEMNARSAGTVEESSTPPTPTKAREEA